MLGSVERARVSALSTLAAVFGLAFVGCSSDPAPGAPAADASTSDVTASDAGVGLPDAADGAPEAAVDDSGLPPELVTYCLKYSAAVCKATAACPDAAPADPSCPSGVDTQCLHQMLSVVGALHAGRLVYDAAGLDTCLADAQKPFCGANNLGYGVASCRSIFHGTVADGAPCYSPYVVDILNGNDRFDECATGSCSAGITTCPGKCVPYLKVGDPCTTNGADATPICDGRKAYCDGTQCRPYLTLGNVCDDLTYRCDPAFVCGPHNGDGGSLVCETRQPEGGACTYDSECERFYCITGTCRKGHQGEECEAYPTHCDPGLACAGAAGCQPRVALDGACDPTFVERSDCAVGLACEAVGVDDAGTRIGACHTIRTPTAGQPCFNDGCASGFWCDGSGSSATCRAAGAVGEACSQGDDTTCAAGLTCNGDTGQCQAPSALGGACSPTWIRTCATGLGCSAKSVCEAKVAPGGACDAVGACPTGYFCDGTCQKAKIPGTACSGKEGECFGGACDTTKGTCNGSCVDPG